MEGNNLDAAIESLLNVEKQCRLAGDVAGTRKAAIDIVELCFKDAAWKTLNDQIVVLSKRRGQLKQCHITSNSDIRKDLQGLLTEDDLIVVLSSKHRPRCIIEFISQSLQMLDFEEHRRSVMVGVLIEEPFPMLALDAQCKKLHDSMRDI